MDKFATQCTKHFAHLMNVLCSEFRHRGIRLLLVQGSDELGKCNQLLHVQKPYYRRLILVWRVWDHVPTQLSRGQMIAILLQSCYAKQNGLHWGWSFDVKMFFFARMNPSRLHWYVPVVSLICQLRKLWLAGLIEISITKSDQYVQAATDPPQTDKTKR